MAEAYVTLATNDQYALGALVLAHSLKSVNTTKQLCVLITPDVTSEIRDRLNSVFNDVVTVNVLDSNDTAHLALLKRPELGVTLTKLHCWSLTQYTKCVFLDADVLAVQNADELFEKPELSAACDVGWPDCFNSGMFVFSPSLETYRKLLKHAEDKGSFDGGDQGLLNTFFPDWNRLSFIYNMVASATYTYLPAYKQFGSDVKFVHFLGSSKPWHQRFHGASGTVETRPGQEFVSGHLNAWWRICSTLVQPEISQEVCHNVSGDSPPTHTHEQPREMQAPPSHNTFSDYEYHDNNNAQVNTPHESYPFSLPEERHKCSPTFPEPFHLPASSAPTVETIHSSNEAVEFGESCDQNRTGEAPSCRAPSPPPQYINYSEPYIEPTDYLIESKPVPVESPKVESSTQTVRPETTLTKSDTQEDTKEAVGARLKVNPTPIKPDRFKPFVSCRIPSPFSVTRKSGRSVELSEKMLGLNMAESASAESRQRWESGIPDYLGKDSFSNILAYIDDKLKSE